MRHAFRDSGFSPHQMTTPNPQSFAAVVTQSALLRSPRRRFECSPLPGITIGGKKLVQRQSLEHWKKLNESGYDGSASGGSEVGSFGRVNGD